MLALIPFVLSNWRILVGCTAIIAIGLGAWHEYDVILAKGATQAIEKVEQANDAAKKSADEAQAEVDACYNGGGTWDRVAGVCKRPAR